ncbi:MAG: TetR/AcrR family transcriptional regulator [Pseudomonadota bacterium]
MQHPAQDDDTTSSPRNRRNAQRRRVIFRALHDCIIEHGYSKTTLAHIARKAEMSASHLLYYFQGKEHMLEEYFATVAQWFLLQIERIAKQPTEEQIELWAQLWFGEGEDAYNDIGFMLECFGEAVHDGVMRKTKGDFDRQCKEFLKPLFPLDPNAPHDIPQGSKARPSSSEEAAEVAYSLLIGLRSSVYFSDGMSASSAARYFQDTVRSLQQH